MSIEAIPAATFTKAVEQMLAGKKPTPEAEVRKHLLATQILPMIDRWGFAREFHQEILELHPKQRAVLDRMEELMTGKGAIIALLGERGLGKTSVAAQFAIRKAWSNYEASLVGTGKREHVIYRKCIRIVDRYKPLFADFGCTDSESLRQSLEFLCREQEHLVIDEVGECDDMKYKRAVLTDLIDRRYSAKRDTILIANQAAEVFAQTIGDSILSRLTQYGAIISCKWPTFRVAK